MTRVVHISQTGGIKGDNIAYIGRAGKGHDGYFGNPVAIGKVCTECKKTHNTGGSTLPCYEQYLIRRLQEPEFRAKVLELDGKTLQCFCVKAPWKVGDGGTLVCHGQVLANYIEKLK